MAKVIMAKNNSGGISVWGTSYIGTEFTVKLFPAAAQMVARVGGPYTFLSIFSGRLDGYKITGSDPSTGVPTYNRTMYVADRGFSSGFVNKLIVTKTGGLVGRAGALALATMGRGAARLLPGLSVGVLAYDAYNLFKDIAAANMQRAHESGEASGNPKVTSKASGPYSMWIPSENDIPSDYDANGFPELNPEAATGEGDAQISNMKDRISGGGFPPGVPTDARLPYADYMQAIADSVNAIGLTPSEALTQYITDLRDQSKSNAVINSNPMTQLMNNIINYDDSPSPCVCLTRDDWHEILSESLANLSIGGGSELVIPEGGISVNLDKYLLLGGTADPNTLNIADVIPSALSLDINTVGY